MTSFDMKHGSFVIEIKMYNSILKKIKILYNIAI